MPEPVPTPSQEALLYATKVSANADLIRFYNGLTTNSLAMWPEAERGSWYKQEPEANAILAAGEAATLDMAPHLALICFYEFGEADDATRLDQVKAKAPVVHYLATKMLDASAFVNGRRSRVQRLIEACPDSAEVITIRDAAMMEGEQYRMANGL